MFGCCVGVLCGFCFSQASVVLAVLEAQVSPLALGDQEVPLDLVDPLQSHHLKVLPFLQVVLGHLSRRVHLGHLFLQEDLFSLFCLVLRVLPAFRESHLFHYIPAFRLYLANLVVQEVL